MPKQHLYDPDVGSRFQKMGGKAMPQGPDRDFFIQPCCFRSFEADMIDRFPRNRTIGIAAREKQVGGTSDFPVCAQQIKQVRRKHYVAILPAFALIDANEHAR